VAAQTESSKSPEVRSLATDRPSWSGDFDGMLKRRLVRVAMPYSRSLFYHDRERATRMRQLRNEATGAGFGGLHRSFVRA
jgi:hypothetical protein